jgi:hypothetical protein
MNVAGKMRRLALLLPIAGVALVVDTVLAKEKRFNVLNTRPFNRGERLLLISRASDGVYVRIRT